MSKKNIKVAIFFAGQPRFIEGKSYRSVKKHLLDVYDCKVFCHYWKSDKPQKTGNFNGELPYFICDKNTENILNNLYNPVKIRNDPPLEIKFPDKFYDKLYNNNTNVLYCVASHYRSMQLSVELIENINENFDFYIILRYDGIIETLPDFTTLNKNILYFEGWHMNSPVLVTCGIISGNKYLFCKLMKMYEEYNDLCDIVPIIYDEVLIYQYVIKHHLNFQNITRDIFAISLPIHYNMDMT